MTAYLVLENGITFTGKFFGKPVDVTGEIVFTTSMTGYLEAITDPSFYGQIILQTFPLGGNYGVISSDIENDNAFAKAFIVKYPCPEPSNFRSEEDLDTFFMSKGITGLKDIDTRALAKVIRNNHSIKGKITTKPPTEQDINDAYNYKITNAIAAVSTKNYYKLDANGDSKLRVAVLDLGVKRSTLHALTSRGCEVHVFPHNTSASEIQKIAPHGILLSSGPGDPRDPSNSPIVQTIRTLQASGTTIFGICLGHSLLALANGLTTKTLSPGPGHRGSNQPVKDMTTGKVYMTAQNHGYAVAMPSLDHNVTATNSSTSLPEHKITQFFTNVNDGTCEGLDYGNSFSVQFRPGEGPSDTQFVYDLFIERMQANATR